MDAIKSVENEVDKVLRLFSTCKDSCGNKIDQLIELVEKTTQEIERLSTRKFRAILVGLNHHCLTRISNI